MPTRDRKSFFNDSLSTLSEIEGLRSPGAETSMLLDDVWFISDPFSSFMIAVIVFHSLFYVMFLVPFMMHYLNLFVCVLLLLLLIIIIIDVLTCLDMLFGFALLFGDLSVVVDFLCCSLLLLYFLQSRLMFSNFVKLLCFSFLLFDCPWVTCISSDCLWCSLILLTDLCFYNVRWYYVMFSDFLSLWLSFIFPACL